MKLWPFSAAFDAVFGGDFTSPPLLMSPLYYTECHPTSSLNHGRDSDIRRSRRFGGRNALKASSLLPSYRWRYTMCAGALCCSQLAPEVAHPSMALKPHPSLPLLLVSHISAHILFPLLPFNFFLASPLHGSSKGALRGLTTVWRLLRRLVLEQPLY